MRGYLWGVVISGLIVIAVVGLDPYAYLDSIDATAPSIPSYYANLVQLRVETHCQWIEIDYWIEKIHGQIIDVERELRKQAAIKETN